MEWLRSLDFKWPQRPSLGISQLFLTPRLRDLSLCGHLQPVKKHDLHRREIHVAWALGPGLQDGGHRVSVGTVFQLSILLGMIEVIEWVSK